MSAFIQRSKQSLRHRSRPPPKEHNIETFLARKKKDKQFNNDPNHDDQGPSVGSNPSSSTPRLKDSGPSGTNRYSHADTFWNSTMTGTDDKEKGRLRRRVRESRPNELSRHMRSRNVLDDIQEDDGMESSLIEAVAWQRCDGHTFGRQERMVYVGKERPNGKSTATFCVTPECVELTANPLRQQRSSNPPTSSTGEWDDLMDGSMQIYHAGSEQPDAVLEEPAFATWPLAAIWEERHLLKTPLGHFGSNPSSDKASKKPTMLTWNSCLNAILNNEAVDSAMKIVMKNRMKSSRTANGNSKDEPFFFSAAEAGLVPNFSYPVTGSPFFDRLAAEKASISVLTNGWTRDNDFEQSQRTSTTTNRLLDLDFDLRLPKRSSSLPLYPINISSPAFSDSIRRTPSSTNTDTIAQCVNSLLSDVLTPLELNLHRENLHEHPTPLPIHTRLIHSLLTLLYHLQDRIMHLEDNLLPRLGTALEHKTSTIDVIGTELRKLEYQIDELNQTVDLGSKILAGCWVREYEIWRTLVEIRKSRDRGWRRWLKRQERAPEGLLSSNQQLMKREIDALVLMADQNIQVLREDVNDMVKMMEGCKRRPVVSPAVETMEQSWRDIL